VPGCDVVLVIGGTGFIGRPLVSQLVDAGCEVRVLTRRNGQPTRNRVSYVRGDVSSLEAIRRAAEGVQVVYDLSPGGGLTWEEMRQNVVRGAENVARVCVEQGVRRLIYTSSIAALQLSRDRTIDESAGTDPKPHLRNPYARGKILAERVLMQLHEEQKLPVVIFRPGIVLGAGNENKLAHPGIGVWLSPTFCESLGGGRTPLPLVLVEDVAQALLLAKDAAGIEGRAFNLVGDVRLSLVDYIEAARERTLRNFRTRPTSLAAIQGFQILIWLAKAIMRPKDNSWPSYYELKNAAKKSQIDCSAAKVMLGWQPVADREAFLQRAMDCHVALPRGGDLRVEPSLASRVIAYPRPDARRSGTGGAGAQPAQHQPV
jgi:nucleoside-diphosphate-sugar epimerase